MIIELSDRLVLVGTSHVAKKSLREITKAYNDFNPDVIAIELDAQRLQALLAPAQPRKYPLSLIRQVGLGGYLFLIIGGWAQRRVGRIVNIEPGAEMKHAYKLAKENKKKVLLADRPIQQTLQGLSRAWGLKEKIRMVFDVILSPFQKNKMYINIRDVPSENMLVQIMGYFKGRYPSLYEVLVASRDKYMTDAIKKYHKQFPDQKILLIVGAGHAQGIQQRFG